MIQFCYKERIRNSGGAAGVATGELLLVGREEPLEEGEEERARQLAHAILERMSTSGRGKPKWYRRRHMADQYHIDLERFSLERFKRILGTSELLPGRRGLKEKIIERFGILESMGISNLKELIAALGTKKKVERFAQESGLPKEYLVVLRREANSYVPKPFNLRGVPGVDPVHIERLSAIGIKNTKHLFERARSRSDRAGLARLAEVPSSDILELVKLSDLARIGGVGPVFARLLYEAGADTLEKFLERSPDELLERLHVINQEKEYTRIMPSLKDIAYCIETARELPKVVEY